MLKLIGDSLADCNVCFITSVWVFCFAQLYLGDFGVDDKLSVKQLFIMLGSRFWAQAGGMHVPSFSVRNVVFGLK